MIWLAHRQGRHRRLHIIWRIYEIKYTFGTYIPTAAIRPFQAHRMAATRKLRVHPVFRSAIEFNSHAVGTPWRAPDRGTHTHTHTVDLGNACAFGRLPGVWAEFALRVMWLQLPVGILFLSVQFSLGQKSVSHTGT